MVLLHYKGTEGVEFIIERKTTDGISEVTNDLVALNNAWMRIRAAERRLAELKESDGAVVEAREYLSAERLKRRALSTLEEASALSRKLEAAIAECDAELECDSRGMHDAETAQLWFASRKLERGKALSSLVRVEKSKLVVKLTRDSLSSMPVREQPADSEETRGRMLAIWHKRQQMESKLAADSDNSYIGSQWADPRALSASLHGLDKVRFR